MAKNTKKTSDTSQLANKENVLTQLEFEVFIAEYNSLRDEIINRLNIQQQITNYSIALIASAFAIRQLIAVGNSSLGQISQIVYVLLSIVFSCFALMYAEHDLFMGDIGTYINKSLRPTIKKILDADLPPKQNEKILGWDEYRAKIHYYSSFTNDTFYVIISYSRYVTTIFPSIGLLVLYWLEHPSFLGMTFVEITLFCFSALLSLFSIMIHFFIRKRYVQIAK